MLLETYWLDDFSALSDTTAKSGPSSKKLVSACEKIFSQLKFAQRGSRWALTSTLLQANLDE